MKYCNCNAITTNSFGYFFYILLLIHILSTNSSYPNLASHPRFITSCFLLGFLLFTALLIVLFRWMAAAPLNQVLSSLHLIQISHMQQHFQRFIYKQKSIVSMCTEYKNCKELLFKKTQTNQQKQKNLKKPQNPKKNKTETFKPPLKFFKCNKPVFHTLLSWSPLKITHCRLML